MLTLPPLPEIVMPIVLHLLRRRDKNREHENAKVKEEIVALKEKVMSMTKCNDDVQRQKHRLQDKLQARQK